MLKIASTIYNKIVDKKRTVRRYWGIVSTILVALVVALAVYLVAMRLLGYSLYTVMSGSMEPAYHVGALIYVKNVDTSTLEKGDVITFVADENNTIVTHRIDEVIKEEDGTLKFQTKGDANDVADAKLVHYKNVLGTPTAQVPLLGYLAYYIQRPPGIYIALAVGVLLLAMIIAPAMNKGKEHK